MNRRGFLTSILAAGVAPAIVRADSLMRIVPMDAAFFYLDPTVPPYPGPASMVKLYSVAGELLPELDLVGRQLKRSYLSFNKDGLFCVETKVETLPPGITAENINAYLQETE